MTFCKMESKMASVVEAVAKDEDAAPGPGDCCVMTRPVAAKIATSLREWSMALE